ncbi:MAG: hypothetical protein Q3M30_02900 [Candidatus Electrothrix sp. Rat3]|nr:hypothetical protein [Candidatus Electrothrix rattekaaiensis]
MLVRRVLTDLQQEFPNLKVESVDILTHPGRTLRQRIRMIPTLQAGNQRLSGLLLGRAAIRAFIEQALQAEHNQ